MADARAAVGRLPAVRSSVRASRRKSKMLGVGPGQRGARLVERAIDDGAILGARARRSDRCGRSENRGRTVRTQRAAGRPRSRACCSGRRRSARAAATSTVNSLARMVSITRCLAAISTSSNGRSSPDTSRQARSRRASPPSSASRREITFEPFVAGGAVHAGKRRQRFAVGQDLLDHDVEWAVRCGAACAIKRGETAGIGADRAGRRCDRAADRAAGRWRSACAPGGGWRRTCRGPRPAARPAR